MKRFVYEVAGVKFEDTVAFGEAWKKAKAFAEGKGVAIYRTVYQEEHDVYCKGGFFQSTDSAKLEDRAIF